VIRVSSIFSQMLQLFSRKGSSRRSRSTGPSATLAVQLLGTVRGHVVLSPGAGAVLAGDLRRTGRQRGKLRHLGCPMRPSASPWPMPTSIGPGSCTAAVFYQLLGRCREASGPHGFASRTNC